MSKNKRNLQSFKIVEMYSDNGRSYDEVMDTLKTWFDDILVKRFLRETIYKDDQNAL